MSRYRLTIHPGDAQTWMEMTGRDELEAPPVGSRTGLSHMLAAARLAGVRVLTVTEVEEADR